MLVTLGSNSAWEHSKIMMILVTNLDNGDGWRVLSASWCQIPASKTEAKIEKIVHSSRRISHVAEKWLLWVINIIDFKDLLTPNFVHNIFNFQREC